MNFKYKLYLYFGSQSEQGSRQSGKKRVTLIFILFNEKCNSDVQ